MIPDKYKPQPETPPPTAYYQEPAPTPSPTYTPEQFETQYGFRPAVPEGAVITGVKKTPEGYQITYYVSGRAEPRKRFVGETPPRQVGYKLGLLEASLLMRKGYAYEAVYPKAPPDPLRPVGIPPFTALPSKLERMEKSLLERRGWAYDPATKKFFKYEIVEEKKVEPAETWQEWLAMPGFRVATPYEALVYRTAKGETYTRGAIRRVEAVQEWLMQMPLTGGTTRFYGKQWTYEKPGEKLAKTFELAYIPVGVMRTMEATVGLEPSLTGAAVGTIISPLPSVQVGPFWIGGRGEFTTAPLTHYWEETREHPGLMIGEVIGEVALIKYVWGPAFSKAWKGAKWVGGRVKRGYELFFRERVLYKRAVLGAKEIIPEKDVFRVLIKTSRGWEYKTLRITERLTKETGKKATWKVPTWKKPFGFKPKLHKWFPPEPMKATVLRELPKDFITTTGKGTALIGKQMVKEAPKQILKPRVPKLVLPTVLIAELPKIVPSLVRYKGKQFPSIYKQKKEVMLLPLLKLRPYPKEKKKVKLKTIPKALLLPREIELLKKKELLRVRETQILKQPQLPKLAQLEKQAQLQSVKQIQQQIQRQIQEQTKSYRLRLRTVKGKRRWRKRYGEEWFFKRHPLATAEEVAKDFLG